MLSTRFGLIAPDNREDRSRFQYSCSRESRRLTVWSCTRPLLTITAGPHVLVLSPAILVEVLRVLTYPKVRERWPSGDDSIDQRL
jgi:hypothetical protein